MTLCNPEARCQGCGGILSLYPIQHHYTVSNGKQFCSGGAFCILQESNRPSPATVLRLHLEYESSALYRNANNITIRRGLTSRKRRVYLTLLRVPQISQVPYFHVTVLCLDLAYFSRVRNEFY